MSAGSTTSRESGRREAEQRLASLESKTFTLQCSSAAGPGELFEQDIQRRLFDAGRCNQLR